MANFKFKFIDCVNPKYTLEINHSKYYSKTFDQEDFKCIDLAIVYSNEEKEPITFSMDLSTAIKVAKTLRTEINKFKESEVNNG